MRSFALTLTGIVALSTAAHAADSNIRSYVTKVDDFSASAKVVQQNQRELSKISRDIGLAYKLGSIRIQYKEPNKVRMEGSLEGSRAVYILNGTVQYVSIPKIGIKTRRNFEDAPGKSKTLMDMGLVSDFYLSFVNARYERDGAVDGVECAIFDMTYKDRDEDTSHHRVWIDPKTRVVRKREAYSQQGKLQAVYFYKDVKEVASGIWLPTRIEVMNTDRKTAGVMAYSDIKVNSGLSDGLFSL
jgi:outer membrane lipoprotein-sorting protein